MAYAGKNMCIFCSCLRFSILLENVGTGETVVVILIIHWNILL